MDLSSFEISGHHCKLLQCLGLQNQEGQQSKLHCTLYINDHTLMAPLTVR